MDKFYISTRSIKLYTSLLRLEKYLHSIEFLHSYDINRIQKAVDKFCELDYEFTVGAANIWKTVVTDDKSKLKLNPDCYTLMFYWDEWNGKYYSVIFKGEDEECVYF